MTAITYQITTDLGMKPVTGERCDLNGLFGAEFGVHEDTRQDDFSMRRWVVTHIESGLAVAFGPTKASTVFAAKERLEAKGEEAFRKGAQKGVERRTQAENFDTFFSKSPYDE